MFEAAARRSRRRNVQYGTVTSLAGDIAGRIGHGRDEGKSAPFGRLGDTGIPIARGNLTGSQGMVQPRGAAVFTVVDDIAGHGTGRHTDPDGNAGAAAHLIVVEITVIVGIGFNVYRGSSRGVGVDDDGLAGVGSVAGKVAGAGMQGVAAVCKGFVAAAVKGPVTAAVGYDGGAEDGGAAAVLQADGDGFVGSGSAAVAKGRVVGDEVAGYA